jgi:preprotein translocase subunit SecE
MANPAKFMREVRQETNKVTWPTRKETVQTTIMVFVMVTLIAIFFLAVDWMLGSVVQSILGFGR